MQLHFIETTADPKTYTYPYRVYATKEPNDTLAEIYNQGFLASRIKPNYFYMARSLRIDLSQFSLTSENRRILRKTAYLQRNHQRLPLDAYDLNIGRLATKYFLTKFNRRILTARTIRRLCTEGFFTDLLTFTDLPSPADSIGYAIIISDNEILHYTYPFYDMSYYSKNIGIGMMLSTILWAKESNKKYVYLGTCYTQEAKYKLQFTGLEWWNGKDWSRDIEKLKSLLN